MNLVSRLTKVIMACDECLLGPFLHVVTHMCHAPVHPGLPTLTTTAGTLTGVAGIKQDMVGHREEIVVHGTVAASRYGPRRVLSDISF